MARNRKFLILAMTVCALLVLSVAAAAAEPEETENPVFVEADDSRIFQNGGLSGPQSMPAAEGGIALLNADTDAVYQLIYQGMLDRQETVYIAGYGITVENLNTIYQTVVNDHPELFYVTGGFRYSYSGSTVTWVSPWYNASLATTENIEAFNTKVDTIINETIEPGMSDLEKALALHDYLVQHCAYNWEVATTGTTDKKIVWSAYGVLIDGDGVCQGYALAYKLLLNRVGIEAGLISSNAMNHAWNWVKLGNYYYHVDVTWDDPTPNTEGRCGHTYFLLSDATISDANHNHTGWDANSPTCDSTQYESGWVFCTSNHPLYLRDGAYHYIISTREEYALYKTSALDVTGTKIVDLANSWHTGYGIVWMEDYVYYVPHSYAAQRTLKACNLDNGTITAIGTFSFTATAVDKYPADYDYIGLRIDSTGAKLEAVSSTRREVLYSTDIRDYPVEWGSLTLAGGERAKLAGLYQAGDGECKAGILLSEEVSGQTVLCAAFYDSHHKMTGLRYVTVSAGCGGLQVVPLGSAALPAYEKVSLFLTDSTYAPLCGKWSPT